MSTLPLVSPTTAGYTTVELDPAVDKAAMIDVDEWAFAFVYPSEALEHMHFVPEPGRSVGVRHEASGELVGMHSSFEGTLTVPGGSLPTAGLTWVGVHPGHRRRGIATAMLTTHLQRTAQRGEPISALFAAEPEIYGRYGYGLAATSVSATLGRGVALREVAGTEDLHCTLERADADRHAEIVDRLLQDSARPGHFHTRNEAHLRNHFVEVPAWREQAELRRIAIVRDGEGTPRAFATFRRTEKWEDPGPCGTLGIGLWAALDGAASRCLFGTLTDLDLMASTKVGALASDAPLLTQLVNVRTAALRTRDNIWLRIVDLPTALAGRRYSAGFDVVLEATDTLLPVNAGRWRIVGGPEGAEVTRADDDATIDLTLDVRELATAYLGGTTFAALAAAGLVTAHSPQALDAISTAFTSSLAPVCSWGF